MAVKADARPEVRRSLVGALLLPALAAVGIALRLRQFLSGRSLWLDEVFLAESFADVGFPQILTEPLRSNQSAPPGFLAASQAVVEMLGTGDAALRLVPLAAGIATVLLAVVVARRLLQHLAAQAAFVTLVSLSPALTYYATEVKQYSLEVLAVMAVLALWSIRDSPRAAWWIGLGGLAIALVSLTGLVALAALALALATEELTSPTPADQRDQSDHAIVGLLRKWWPIGLLWIPGFALHGLYTLHAGVDRTYMQEWWGTRDGFPPPLDATLENLAWYPTWLMRLAWVGIGERGRVLATADTGPLVVSLLVAGLIVAAFWGRRDLRLLFGFTFAVALALALLRLYPTSGRLSLYATPYIFLGVATGVDVALHRKRQLWGVLAVGAVGLLVAAQLTVAVPLVAQPFDDRDGRWAVNQALSQFTADDALIFERSGQKAQWYLRGKDLGSGAVYTLSVDDVIASGTSGGSDLSAHRRLWILSNHRIERASRLAEELVTAGGYRLLCTASPSDQTYLALVVRNDVADRDGTPQDCTTAPGP